MKPTTFDKAMSSAGVHFGILCGALSTLIVSVAVMVIVNVCFVAFYIWRAWDAP